MVLLHELYQRFSGKIKKMIMNSSGTEDDAADIFQDVLLSVYDKAKNGSFILTCPLEAFLYLISKNRWTNELKKRKNIKVTITDAEGYNISEDSFKLAEEFMLQQQRKAFLLEKLEELGNACKELLLLSWSEKSMDDVASILNISYGYARKKKSDCIGKLMVLVKESCEYNFLKW